ncbi:MAG: hypothetical protein U0559_01185 [Anaerolineae bacterium]
MGERLGLGAYFNYTDEVDYLNQQLAPPVSPLTTFARECVEAPQALIGCRRNGVEVQHTQWQDRNASQTLRKANHPAVPAWAEPPARPLDRSIC